MDHQKFPVCLEASDLCMGSMGSKYGKHGKHGI